MGAEAVIIHNNIEGDLNGTLGGENDAFVPATGISQAAGQALLADLESGAVNVTLDLQVFSEMRETFNVLAETAAGREDNVVMLGAHLDSVTEGAGIYDNGSGSAGILEVAIQLAKVKKLNNTVRFAWWGAEELGLIGSTAYVEGLDDDGRARIKAYINLDMIGSINHVYQLGDGDGSTTGKPAPAMSGELEAFFLADFAERKLPIQESRFLDRSDYKAFAEAGIGVAQLNTGHDTPKSPQQAVKFGGTANAPLDPCYHKKCDDMTNVNMDVAEVITRSMARAAQHFGVEGRGLTDE